jgi:hypothetical protein
MSAKRWGSVKPFAKRGLGRGWPALKRQLQNQRHAPPGQPRAEVSLAADR